MMVHLVTIDPPPPPPPPPTPETPTQVVEAPPPPAPPAEPPKPNVIKARPAPATREMAPVYAEPAPSKDSGVGLSDAQLAGAASADSGVGGGACDMARRIQTALRKDHLVASQVAGSGGKAMLVWDGDWVRHPGQDGKGLAAVREAILWEIGFAPSACRGAAVHGLVSISLPGSQGPVRLVLGAKDWRWSDVLAARPTFTE